MKRKLIVVAIAALLLLSTILALGRIWTSSSGSRPVSARPSAPSDGWLPPEPGLDTERRIELATSTLVSGAARLTDPVFAETVRDALEAITHSDADETMTRLGSMGIQVPADWSTILRAEVEEEHNLFRGFVGRIHIFPETVTLSEGLFEFEEPPPGHLSSRAIHDEARPFLSSIPEHERRYVEVFFDCRYLSSDGNWKPVKLGIGFVWDPEADKWVYATWTQINSRGRHLPTPLL